MLSCPQERLQVTSVETSVEPVTCGWVCRLSHFELPHCLASILCLPLPLLHSDLISQFHVIRYFSDVF